MRPDPHAVERRLEGGAWGALLVWIGVVLLAGLSWAVFLIGVGLLTLGVQAARRILGLRLEGFWVLVGGLFLLGGIWDVVQVSVGLVPVLCIAGGIALIAAALARRPHAEEPAR